MAKMAGLNQWVNRTTRKFIQQISSGGMEQMFPAEVFHDAQGEPTSNANWIHAPDLSAVIGQPTKYWIITGDVVSLMSLAERDAVDAADLSNTRDGKANQLDRVEDILRAFALVVLDEINNLRSQHSLPPRTIAQLKNAVRGKLGS